MTAVVTTTMRMGHNGENPDGHNENWWLQSLQLYFILYTNLRREGQKFSGCDVYPTNSQGEKNDV